MQHNETVRVSEELRAIANASGGILLPEKVVEFASNPETALHGRFTWDDTEAARQYRLFQARQVIRLNVIVIEGSSEPVRAYVSLSNDRDHGGYRRMVDVLSNDDLTSRLLADAVAELEGIKRKYEHLKALVPIWAALGSIDKEGERAAG